MPLKTATPRVRRISAPARLRRSPAAPPQNEREGRHEDRRNRSRRASVVALNLSPASSVAWRTPRSRSRFSRPSHENHETDLGEDVDIHVFDTHANGRTKQAHGRSKNYCHRQAPALVLRASTRNTNTTAAANTYMAVLPPVAACRSIPSSPCPWRRQQLVGYVCIRVMPSRTRARCEIACHRRSRNTCCSAEHKARLCPPLAESSQAEPCRLCYCNFERPISSMRLRNLTSAMTLTCHDRPKSLKLT